MQLFFPDFTNSFLKSSYKIFFGEEDINSINNNSLSIVFPVENYKADPFDYDFYGKQILSNVFDSLVVLDKNFRIKPSLAYSYGLISDNVWNFRLRKNVKFHNSMELTFSDVEKTFEFAKNSQFLSTFISSIDKLEKIDDFEFNIITKYPDPLLLSKLTMLYIVPFDFSYENQFIGTGRFVYDKKVLNELFLYPSQDSWCGQSKIKEIKVIFEEDANNRIDLFLEGDADFLAFVPHGAIPIIRQYGFNVISLPSLEVQSLMFNLNSKIFSDKANRKTFASMIDKNDILNRFASYLTISSQFVGSGVFGFNPNIAFPLMTDSEIHESINNFPSLNVILVLPQNLELLANVLKNQLSKYGINLVLKLVSEDNLLNEIPNSDLFFMSFKTDLGDLGDFLSSVVKSDSKNNFQNFKNLEIDELILMSEQNLLVFERLKLLQEIMKLVVEDYVIGIPLFEYDVFYAFNKNLSFEPSLNGLIDFNEIKFNDN